MDVKNIDYDEQSHLRTYWYRWYICFVFSLMGLIQGAIWNTWAPIDESAKLVFGFSAAEIELLVNWGEITFFIFMPIFMWCLDKKGLKFSTIVTAFLVALGAGLRCLPINLSILRYFIHAGHILNGIGGCVLMAAPPLLSMIWFPPKERITATGIATLFSYMGDGTAYIVAMVVQEPSNFTKLYCHQNVTLLHNNSCHEVSAIRHEINIVLYVEFGIAFLLFVSMLIFFPDRPPLPPSKSASIPRRNWKAGLLELRHHKQFWIVAITSTLVIATWTSWTGVMPIVLKPLNIHQKESGLLGFVLIIVGTVVGILIGWFTDRLKGRMKLVLCILFGISLLVMIYFILVCNQWIHVIPFLPHSPEIWTACIILGILMNASIPLSMEMAADAGYPTSEGTTTSIVVWLISIVSFFFYFVLEFLPDPLSANYIILGSMLISLPVILFFVDERNQRLGIDINGQTDINASEGYSNLLADSEESDD